MKNVIARGLLSNDSREQATFGKADQETGQWEKCRSCSHVNSLVAGWVDQCEKCGRRQGEPATG
jgi:hypothetical protein